jgi:DNA-directed RNA polymerase I, II, and III subunit RPABC2
MADEFRADEEDNVDEPELEEEGEEELEGVEAEQVRSDAADLQKLYKQHPEIWIPYEEDVLVNLATRPPLEAPPEAPEALPLGLRNTGHVDEAHRTYPFLTQYEKTKILSFRASQIGHGAAPYIVVPKGVTDSYLIAKLELKEKRLPFIVKRPLPDGRYEVWKLADLVVQ